MELVRVHSIDFTLSTTDKNTKKGNLIENKILPYIYKGFNHNT